MLPFAFLPNLGTTELMVVAFVSLLIFGNRLPSVMRSLGKSVTEFKKGVSGIEDDIDQAVTADKREEADPAPGRARECAVGRRDVESVESRDRVVPTGHRSRTRLGVDRMFPHLGLMEMIVVMGVAVLLFGKRLPEVGRSLGKGIIEFKKGLRGIEDEFDFSSIRLEHVVAPHRGPGAPRPTGGDYAESSVPKFEPPTTAPSPRWNTSPSRRRTDRGRGRESADRSARSSEVVLVPISAVGASRGGQAGGLAGAGGLVAAAVGLGLGGQWRDGPRPARGVERDIQAVADRHLAAARPGPAARRRSRSAPRATSGPRG